MSFFGLQQTDLEQDKRKFLESGLHESEDVAVYTWGEDSYDGLGDALQEGGDELNDETFGGSGAVGKDFDFSNPALPEDKRVSHDAPQVKREQSVDKEPHQHQQPSSLRPSQPSRSTAHSLEAIWDDKSPFSVLPRMNSTSRASPAPSAKFSPFASETFSNAGQQSVLHKSNQPQPRVRTLQEIEAEMLQQRSAAQRQQEVLLQQRHHEEEHIRLAQEQELQRQQRIYQQEQQQLQIHRLLQQQREQQQHMRTPPPRMLPVSQSPRFLEHQRQILLLQQQQEQQQQQRLQELQEQLRFEEIERQMVAQMTLQQNPNQYASRRAVPNLTSPENQVLQHQQLQRRQRSQSPVTGSNITPIQDNMSYLPQNIQLQQRLLSEMTQAEYMRDIQGASQAEQEALRAEAMRKIVEAEKMEEKRRRKAAKIAHMARYNDLMTQSDKDFITRIQVSQLVTQDPYADDFYAQVYGAILRSRMGLQSQDERVIKFGSGGGIGLGLAQKGGNRRPNAMQRMEQQVERIVSNARKREEEKGLHSLHSLQGALGKTSGRSYKAAPRQLLQVDASNPSASPTISPAHAHISKSSNINESAAKEAAKLGREALGTAADTDNLVRKEPLTQREVLIILERLYDIVLRVEQLRRDQPLPEDDESSREWQKEYDSLVDELWVELRVMVPLETSHPHPFISLLTPTKGKKILPRLTRHLSSERMLTLLTLLVACFSQLDVIRQASVLDSNEDSREHADVERQTQAFLGSVMQSILPHVSNASLRLVTGLLGLLLDRSNIAAIAQSKPGLALLTLFLSRVEVIKQTSGSELAEIPSSEEQLQWQTMFDHLFELLAPYFIYLFPSTRAPIVVPPGHSNPADIADQPVWQFLAALALHAVIEQHQVLVTSLREKVLDIILSVNKGWVASEEERQTKLANVNLFLHALGLDSSQVAL
ncbi:topoisomerase II-associated protein PAT1 [Crucibulum laeve]|uniref:Topoisomerase II-associated protein PAT1 n=1 Tax=Crucibulum laeve TaxID=68775 RepID=A0A5C3LI81_9AGAR|nr:topoisomerase II-associated protein PAT1 [Crucibulum laeve]